MKVRNSSGYRQNGEYKKDGTYHGTLYDSNTVISISDSGLFYQCLLSKEESGKAERSLRIFCGDDRCADDICISASA